jgi:hypothetical protein
MSITLIATRPKTKTGSNVWPVVAVFLIALSVRLAAGATLPLFRDEVWHLLAGHSWIHEGTLRVDQGAYTRAGYFTVLVAWFMEAFGETLAVARLPGILCGAGLVTAVFVWLRRKSGTVAAWTGAMLLCFYDLSILLSAEVRFYTLHALSLWLGAAIVYQVTDGNRNQRQPVWMLAVAAALFAVALHVQVTAGVALVALVSWAICDLAYQSKARLWALVRGHWILAAATGLIVLAGAIGMILHPPAALAQLYAEFRFITLFKPSLNWVFFYQRFFSDTITLLWALFPLAFIAALVHRPRAAIFCAVLLVVPVVIMSFGGMKNGRYVFFALPYLFATWGLAAEAVLPKAMQIGYETWGRAWSLIVRSWPGSMAAGERRLRPYSFATAAILVVAFAMIGQRSYLESTKLLLKSTTTVLSRPAQLLVGPDLEPWASHRKELTGMIERASVFIATMPATTIYELGTFDVILHGIMLDEVIRTSGGSPKEAENTEFTTDPRSGRPMISTLESLQAIMSCYHSGIIIVTGEYWRNRGVVTDEMANFLVATAHLTKFTGPTPDDDLLVLEWQGQLDARSPQCDEIRSKVSRAR